MAGTNFMQRLAGWFGRDNGEPLVRPHALTQAPAQDPAYLQAARHLVGLKSGQEANGWLASGGDFLAVTLGDGAHAIVERWNAGPGHATPMQDELPDAGSAPGTSGYLAYRGVRRPYSLRYEQAVDTMIVMATLADLVRNDVELRLCRDSLGGETLAFMALPPSQWHALAAEAGEKAIHRRLVPVPEDFQELHRMALRDLPEWAATAHGRQL